MSSLVLYEVFLFLFLFLFFCLFCFIFLHVNFPLKNREYLEEVDLRNCELKKIPLGIGELDETKVTRIRLAGNPLEGFSSAFLGYPKAKDIILDLRKISEEKHAKWNEIRMLVIGDAAVGL